MLPACSRVYNIQSQSSGESSKRSSKSRNNIQPEPPDASWKSSSESSNTTKDYSDSCTRENNLQPTCLTESDHLTQAMNCAGISEHLLNEWLQTNTMEVFHFSEDNHLIFPPTTASDDNTDLVPSSCSDDIIFPEGSAGVKCPIFTIANHTPKTRISAADSSVGHEVSVADTPGCSDSFLRHSSDCQSLENVNVAREPPAERSTKPRRTTKKKTHRHRGKDWRKIIALCEDNGIEISDLARDIPRSTKPEPAGTLCARVTRGMANRNISISQTLNSDKVSCQVTEINDTVKCSRRLDGKQDQCEPEDMPTKRGLQETSVRKSITTSSTPKKVTSAPRRITFGSHKRKRFNVPFLNDGILVVEDC